MVGSVRALTFWKTVVADKVDFLDRLIALLTEHDIRYCIIGGTAVNAFVEPLVTLDLDIVVAEDFGAQPCLQRGMPSDALVTMARGFKSMSIVGQEPLREGERLPEPPDALPRVDYTAVARAAGFAEGILRHLALALARHESEATAASRP